MYIACFGWQRRLPTRLLMAHSVQIMYLMCQCAALALPAQSRGSCMHSCFRNRKVALLAAIHLASNGLATVPGTGQQRPSHSAWDHG